VSVLSDEARTALTSGNLAHLTTLGRDGSPHVTVVWVGNDQPSQTLGDGEQGARAALPMWMEFMGPALRGIPVPADPYPTPLGIEQARIDPNTGLLVSADDPDSLFEYFESGHLPAKAPDKKKTDSGSDIF